MKLYLAYGSPNCRKVHAMVNQLGLSPDLVALSFTGGDLRRPDYLAINPNGKVPALVDGDFVIWESNAIMNYLADATPNNDLLPKETKARAEVLRWQFWETAHFNRALGTMVFESAIKPMLGLGEPDDTAIKAAIPLFHRFAAVLDQQLQGQRYVAGKKLSIADFSVAGFLMYRDAAQVPLDNYAHIRRWFGEIEALPAWTQSAPPGMA